MLITRNQEFRLKRATRGGAAVARPDDDRRAQKIRVRLVVCMLYVGTGRFSSVLSGLVELASGARQGPKPAGPPLHSAEGDKINPGDRLWESGDVAEHYLDDMTDGIGGVFGSSWPSKTAVDKKLEQVKSE